MSALFGNSRMTIYDGPTKSFLQLRSNLIADQITFGNIVAPATVQAISALSGLADSYDGIDTLQAFADWVPDQKLRILKFNQAYEVIQ